MSTGGTRIGIVALAVIAVGLGYVAWRMTAGEAGLACDACGRPLHEHSRTVGEVDGERQTFCCPTCALTLHRQTEKDVAIVELTDFDSGAPIQPDEAFIVQESDVNLCLRHKMLAGRGKGVSAIEFDRCSPSRIAFATRSGAEAFQRLHGGVLIPFRQLAAAYAEGSERE